jgi:hypothetical protein
MLNDKPNDDTPLDADELMNFADRVDRLPPADAEWVGRLLQEAMRARLHEAELLNVAPHPASPHPELEQQLAQIALDTAEWLKTLWTVGYMGAGSFPAQPRTAFPAVEVEDVLKSALFARIRQGKRPLPFPPPKHHGLPWHELVEGKGETHTVDSDIVRDEQGLPLGATIETCADWHIIEEVAKDREYVVQYQGKGPLYRLQLDTFTAELRREPARWTRKIRLQERGGLRSFALEWPREDGSINPVPLRAATWERAESEAEHWIATKYPELYGQVSFERAEQGQTTSPRGANAAKG